jgi:hypothetical protein
MTVETATDPAQVIEATSAAQADPPAASEPAAVVAEPAAGSEVQPANGDDAATPAASDPPPAAAPPRKSADQRIRELVAENKALRQLAAQNPPAKPAAAEPKPAEPETAPAIEDFEDVSQWAKAFEAHTRKVAAQLIDAGVSKALGKQRESERAQVTQAQFAEREAAYAKENPGYAEAVADPELREYVTQTISQVIVESDVGPALSHYLATNVADLQRISALPPHHQARELGKLEVKIAGAPKRQAGPPAKVVQQTKAPAPPTPVGGTSPSRSREDMPLNEYLANRPWAHRM